MDDKRFDQFIKEKAESFKGPPFEAEGLVKLHSKLAMAGIAALGYARYKAILVAGGVLTLFTLLNFLIIRYFNHQEDRRLLTELESLKETVATLSSIKRDTVYIYQEGQINTNGVPVDKTGSSFSNAVIPKGQRAGHLIYLGTTQELSPETRQFLARNFMLIYNGTDIYLNPVEQGDYRQPEPFHFSDEDTGTGDAGPLHGKAAVDEKGDAGQNLSFKTIRALNKHYGRGIGLKTGVETEVAKHQYDVGDGTLHPAFGIVGEFILSPNWSITTGLRYGIRAYDMEGAENFVDYPGFNAGSGKGLKVEVESGVLEIPVSLRYYYPISIDKKIFMSTGYVPNLYLTQEFEYSQEAIISNNGKSANIINTATFDRVKLYAGAIHATFGISWLLPNDKTLQAGLFYRKGLDVMGMEGRKVNTFGLKAAYLFRVR